VGEVGEQNRTEQNSQPSRGLRAFYLSAVAPLFHVGWGRVAGRRLVRNISDLACAVRRPAWGSSLPARLPPPLLSSPPPWIFFSPLVDDSAMASTQAGWLLRDILEAMI
jgi:hypothetical protein